MVEHSGEQCGGDHRVVEDLNLYLVGSNAERGFTEWFAMWRCALVGIRRTDCD